MSSTTKLNRFDEDYKFSNRSDDTKHFMRKSRNFDCRKPRACVCQYRGNEDGSASDEEDSKPCCGYRDNTKCKNFVKKPDKSCNGCQISRDEEGDEEKYSKRNKSDSWTKNEEKANKLKEKPRCKCGKNNSDDVKSKKNKSDKRVINIYTKVGPDGLPPSNKCRKDECKSKKTSKSIDVIQSRNSKGDNGNDSTDDDNDFDSETEFYASRPDTYRRYLGPTIDETILVCLDLFTKIIMKINMCNCFWGQDSCRRKCIKAMRKELEPKYSSSESSD